MTQTPFRRRGQIVPRSPGKFLLRVELGTELQLDGKKKRIIESTTFTGSRAEAEKVLTAKLAKLDNGAPRLRVTPLSVTEAAQFWLATRAGVGARTRFNYAHRIEAYIAPHFAGVKLRDLSRAAVRQWIAKLSSRYSPGTVRQAYVTLSQVCKANVNDHMLGSNPCIGIELPRIEKIGAESVLTVPQMTLLIEKISKEKHGLLFTTMLLSAVRPQEALALTWGDLTTVADPKTGIEYPALSISKALTRPERGRYEVGPVKTTKGRRLIPLPVEFASVFSIHRGRVTDTSPTGFIFQNANGGHLNPDTIYEAWKRTLKRHGFPAMKLYATRHSALTALLAGGAHPKVASERAGHSSTAVTMEVYSHILPSMQLGALDALPASLTSSIGNLK